MPDKEAFAALIISRRQEEFEALKRAREARAKERRAQRKVEREIARRKEFVKRCRAAVQERVSAGRWLMCMAVLCLLLCTLCKCVDEHTQSWTVIMESCIG